MGPKSGNSTTATGRPRRRAVEACSFCRRRKVVTAVSRHWNGEQTEADILHQIKCNNEQPTCANCKTYGKDCVYEPLETPTGNASSSTPTRRHHGRQKRCTSNSTIHETHTPTAAREPSEADASPAGHDGNAPSQILDDHSSAQPPETPADRGRSHRGDVSRIVVSANGVSSYHGRTSALYEESLQERSSVADLRPRMPDEWIEKGLVAEAAKQRGPLPSRSHGLLCTD